MVSYIYSTIGSGQTYTSPQAWEQATSGFNLVSRDEIHIGIISTDEEWGSLYISNPNSSYVDSNHYRQLLATNSGYYNHRTKNGVILYSVTGGQDYFKLGPGICINRYNATGNAINLSGRRLLLNGLTISNLGQNSVGIRLIDASGESIVANTLVHGNLNNGTGFYTNSSGSFLMNCSLYASGNCVGSTGFSAVNCLSLSDITNAGRIVTSYQTHCASSYSGVSGSIYSGVDPYNVYVNTYRNLENFYPLDENIFVSKSGYKYDNMFIENTWSSVLPSTFSGIASIYSGNSELSSLLSFDLDQNERYGLDKVAIGALEYQYPISNSGYVTPRIEWYKSQYSPDSISGKVGGRIDLNKSITNGHIDIFPTVYSYVNPWNAISDDEKLPYLYLKTGENIETAYLRRVDTDEIIHLRGWNYVNIESGDYLGATITHNDLITYDYDYSNYTGIFALLRRHGYNNIRILLDAGGFGITGHIGHYELGTGLYDPYLDKLAQFVSGAADYKLYTTFYAETVPFNVHYFIDLIQPSSLSINTQIGALNQNHLFTGYMNSKKQYFVDLANAMKNRLGDDVNYISWCVTAEPQLTNLEPPFRRIDQTGSGLILTDGVYPNPNHPSGWWDMRIPSEVTEMTVRTTNHNYTQYVNAIKSVIPDAIVGATVAAWRALYKTNATGWADMQDIYETKYHHLTMRHLSDTPFDLIGANIYPNIFLRNVGNKLVENLPYKSFYDGMIGTECEEIDRTRYGTWIGEYGYYSGIYGVSESGQWMIPWDDNYIRYMKKVNAITSSIFDSYAYFHYTGASMSLLVEENRFYGIYDTAQSGDILYVSGPSTYPNYHYINNTGSYCYRKIYGKLTDGVLYNPRIYISDEEYPDSISIASGKSDDDISFDSFRLPFKYSLDDFYYPKSYESGLALNTLRSGDYFSLWIRLDASGYIHDPYVGFNIKVEGTPYV